MSLLLIGTLWWLLKWLGNILDSSWRNATEYFFTTQFLFCTIFAMAITKYIFGKKNDLDSLIFNSSFPLNPQKYGFDPLYHKSENFRIN
jgi:hypothetical protein